MAAVGTAETEVIGKPSMHATSFLLILCHSIHVALVKNGAEVSSHVPRNHCVAFVQSRPVKAPDPFTAFLLQDILKFLSTLYNVMP